MTRTLISDTEPIMATSSDTPENAPINVLRAYLELVRAPNIFTAMADVVMGFLFVHPSITSDQKLILAVLVGASSCLYAAGMVLNDVFDAEIDARERPTRPIPSGRTPLATARRLGWGLLIAGVTLGLMASWLFSLEVAGKEKIYAARVAAVSGCLAIAIVLYDAKLKGTAIGPIVMGLCRALNVLLGMSAAAHVLGPDNLLAAGAVGVYIAGVTWLARGETGTAGRRQLALATLVILAGIAALLALPGWVAAPAPLLIEEPTRWYLLIGILGAYTGMRCFYAVSAPEPDVVQSAVKHCILSLVILDAAICYVACDIRGAMIVIAFLIPTMLLGRWIYST
jgi:4-hydroxybenzoate polyprenyltransferase